MASTSYSLLPASHRSAHAVVHSRVAHARHSCATTQLRSIYSIKGLSVSASLSSVQLGAIRVTSEGQPCGLSRRRLSRRGILVKAHASSPCGYGYPFKEDDYLRVVLLERAPYGPMKLLPPTDQSAATYSGVLVFQRDIEQPPLTTETPVMEIFVAGDTACNIYTQLHGQKSSRPMVHDLMYNLLRRAGEVNPTQWQLLRVAVVGLEDEIFLGRLFFGDPVTGTVMYDCDCRPSDGVYLSLRTGCPFYVARKVWDHVAVPIRRSKVHVLALHEAQMAAAVQQQQQQEQGSPQQTMQQPHGSGSPPPGNNGGVRSDQEPQPGSPGPHGQGVANSLFEYTAIRLEDPDAIKLLKRELEVAIQEEDYAAAIRLRDHPYMQLYRRIEAFLHMGRLGEADALQRELALMIQRHSSTEPR